MLKTKHFFPFVKMVKALDIKEDLKNIFGKVKGKSEEELAHLDESESLDYFYVFIEKLPNAEKEVMSFLVVYLEKPLTEIDEMPLTEMWSVISGLLSDPSFKAFFRQAVK